jgi:hypothetical protein
MRIFGKAILIILIAALLLPVLALGDRDKLESRPGEKAAEALFNKGIGRPWVGGEPFESTYWIEPKHTLSVVPYTSYQIIGYLNMINSFSLSTDTGKGLQLMPGPGTYPVYAYYSSNQIKGIFIDLSNSGRIVQMNSYL